MHKNLQEVKQFKQSFNSLWSLHSVKKPDLFWKFIYYEQVYFHVCISRFLLTGFLIQNAISVCPFPHQLCSTRGWPCRGNQEFLGGEICEKSWHVGRCKHQGLHTERWVHLGRQWHWGCVYIRFVQDDLILKFFGPIKVYILPQDTGIQKEDHP